MSPLKIVYLLHIYAIAEPYPRPSPAIEQATNDFLRQGLIQVANNLVENPVGYALTDRGRAMVEHLKSVQLPICEWRQP